MKSVPTSEPIETTWARVSGEADRARARRGRVAGVLLALASVAMWAAAWATMPGCLAAAAGGAGYAVGHEVGDDDDEPHDRDDNPDAD